MRSSIESHVLQAWSRLGDFFSRAVQPAAANSAVSHFLAGGGDMGALMRAMDWSSTPLGPIETWSQTLRMMVRLILSNRLQMFLWWGPRFTQIYNDASWPALGDKHPLSMGQPASDCWMEAWHIIGPLIETPFQGGPATWMDDILLHMNRRGFMEETHWTIAYSPVLDDAAPAGIGGVIGTVNEITEKVVGERRVRLLRDLGACSTEPKTAEEACAIAAEALAHHPEDVPFALIYLIGDNGGKARLAGAAGVAMGGAESPSEVDLGGDNGSSGPWPLAEAFRSETIQVLDDLASRLDHVPPGPWPDPPRVAAVCPIASNTANQLAALVVLGVSSHLAFDDAYRRFFGLVASQVATTIANARAYEEERKRTEDALRDREGRSRRYFDLGLIGMAITSPAKGCVEVNDELCRILGYSRSELLQKSWAEMTHPEDLAADVAQFERVLAGEIDDYSMDKRWIGKDGRVIDSVTAAKCMRRPDGSVDYFMGLVLDTTERKRAEQELRKAHAELAHMARVLMIGELTASIAHEINQPLAAVAANSKACLHWLDKSPPNMDEARDALSRISRDANRAARVISGIRRLLKGGEPRTSPLQVGDVIREVATLVKDEAHTRRVMLRVESAADLPQVVADRVQLQQVLLNLVLNALDSLSEVTQRPRTLDIWTETAGTQEVVVAVRDSGVGLEPGSRHRIFDAFFTTKEGGMGMGLAICRSIVEAHGGRIWATANEGPGETLRFTLPVYGMASS
jgi:PAS domain S-box-containing protein